MSDLIERLNAATEGTTPGPWEIATEGNWWWIGAKNWAARVCRVVLYSGSENENKADAIFIAAARQLVPEAADALAAKDAEIARLTAHFETMLQWADTMSAQINNSAEFWTDYNAASEFLERAALTGENGND